MKMKKCSVVVRSSDGVDAVLGTSCKPDLVGTPRAKVTARRRNCMQITSLKATSSVGTQSTSHRTRKRDANVLNDVKRSACGQKRSKDTNSGASSKNFSKGAKDHVEEMFRKSSSDSVVNGEEKRTIYETNVHKSLSSFRFVNTRSHSKKGLDDIEKSLGKNVACNETETKSTDNEYMLKSFLPVVSQLNTDMECESTYSRVANYLKCNICKKMYRNTELLEIHKLHHIDNPHKCSHCPLTFTKRSSMLAHEQKHNGNDSTECPFCKITFINAVRLKTHIIYHRTKKHLSCKYCPKIFLRHSDLKIHRRLHKGKEPFESSEPAFSTKTFHEQIHTEKFCFKCTRCDKKFTRKNDLNNHLVTHIGKTLFNCKKCVTSFTSKSKLSQHELTHVKNDRINSVPLQASKQSSKSTLSTRSKTRQGRESHKHPGMNCQSCNFCNERFAEKDLLIRHERKSHGKNSTFNCMTCNKKFTYKKCLISHQLKCSLL